MKKVLLLFTDVFTARGIQEYGRRLSDALETGFPEIGFIKMSLCGMPKTCSRSRSLNAEIAPRRGKKLGFMQKIFFVFKTVKMALTEKPGFLICGHVNLSPIALFLKKIYGIKYTVLTYGIECWDLKKDLKYYGVKNADLIMTISNYSKNRMMTNGIPGDKIKILCPSVDTKIFCRKPADENLVSQLDLKDRRVLLTVGQVSSQERYKGHDIMLAVLSKLGKGYIWLVVGEGDDLTRLEKKGRGMGVNDRVRFLGKVDNGNLIRFYNLCDVFVMPSKGEGFGIVFLEAMACGKPVIGG
ncbi:MAG: hypothetical protein A2Z72_05850, partial [Omnitrophica bacterium RBG_13_46_9]